jgi:ankyrin repeat protein
MAKMKELFQAAANGDITTIENLIKEDNTLLKAKDYNLNGKSALHIAIENGKLNAVESLLKNGMDKNIKDNLGNTAIHTAAIVGNKEITEYFQNPSFYLYFNFNSKNNKGSTPLQLAIMNEKKELAVYLLNRCSSSSYYNIADTDGNTNLYYAIKNGMPEVVDIILTKLPEIKINEPLNNGKIATHVAASNGHKTVLELLVGRGAKLGQDWRNHKINMTELDVAEEALKKAQNDEEKSKFNDIINYLKEHNVRKFSQLAPSPNAPQQNINQVSNPQARMQLLGMLHQFVTSPRPDIPDQSQLVRRLQENNNSLFSPPSSFVQNRNISSSIDKLTKENKSLTDECLNLKRKVESLEKSKTAQNKEISNLKKRLTDLEQKFNQSLNTGSAPLPSTQTSGQPLPTTSLSNCTVITESERDAKQALASLSSNVNPAPAQSESSKEKQGEKSKKVTEEREKSKSNSRKRGRGE